MPFLTDIGSFLKNLGDGLTPGGSATSPPVQPNDSLPPGNSSTSPPPSNTQGGGNNPMDVGSFMQAVAGSLSPHDEEAPHPLPLLKAPLPQIGPDPFAVAMDRHEAAARQAVEGGMSGGLPPLPLLPTLPKPAWQR